MKKILLGLFLFLVLAIISVFIFIPDQLHISAILVMKANTSSLSRNLCDETKWVKWWPHDNDEKQLAGNNEHLKLNDFTYRLSQKLYNAAEVETINKDQTITGKISIIQLSQDSLAVQWQNSFTTSRNPLTRIMQYRHAVKIKKNMILILDSLKEFCKDTDKIYRFHIYHATLKDTFYISEKTVTTSFPSTQHIYKLIENLRTYARSQKAAEVDFPILNITTKDSLQYEMMAAIPINKILDGNGNIAFKRMIVYKDKILTADVKGGTEKIKEAYDELNIYIKDYNLTTPVISWETLVTDRSKEPDSTKWITRICVPIA